METIEPFVFARMPEIHFGPGKIRQLPSLIAQKGRRVLLVTGAKSFLCSPHYDQLTSLLAKNGVAVDHVSVSGEPSPRFIDDTAAQFRGTIDCVAAIGGGSVVDAGKAISAMLLQEGSVTAFLEGMETRKHDGRKVPFIAVPTSSGTGAEATKNAVLSDIGPNGYKSSLRHDAFVPDVALVDPELILTCPPDVTAACGLDALTQLIEAYVSTKASPITDALAESGLIRAASGFLAAFEQGATNREARSDMAYAALISGAVLANAGLGVVHGFAGPIGGFHEIPHGVVCGTLVGAATRAVVDALIRDTGRYHAALHKYARAGALLTGRTTGDVVGDSRLLVETLETWIERTRIPRLGQFGVRETDLDKILDKSNNKNAPVQLAREQMTGVLRSRL